jgi:hypothetical protein
MANVLRVADETVIALAFSGCILARACSRMLRAAVFMFSVLFIIREQTGGVAVISIVKPELMVLRVFIRKWRGETGTRCSNRVVHGDSTAPSHYLFLFFFPAYLVAQQQRLLEPEPCAQRH